MHIKWDVIVSWSLRLSLKVWIWYKCQDRIGKCYHQDGEQLGFYKKVRINRLSKKKNVLVTFVYQEPNNFNLFAKNGTQNNVKYFRWIVIEQVITSNSTFRLYFLKQIVVPHFQSLFGRNNRDTFLENEGKIYEGRCVIPFLLKFAGWHLSRSLRIKFFTDNFHGF